MPTSAVMRNKVTKYLPRGRKKAKARLGVQHPSHLPRCGPSDLRLQPSEPKPKWLLSHVSQCRPVTPGWHSHCPVRMSHCPLVEPRAWQLHLGERQTDVRCDTQGTRGAKCLSEEHSSTFAFAKSRFSCCEDAAGAALSF